MLSCEELLVRILRVLLNKPPTTAQGTTNRKAGILIAFSHHFFAGSNEFPAQNDSHDCIFSPTLSPTFSPVCSLSLTLSHFDLYPATPPALPQHTMPSYKSAICNFYVKICESNENPLRENVLFYIRVMFYCAF